ncbi:MurR/RpiR family transcriptional regulator [Streptomyces bobili]|uniref:MurR/RpiR family transcriptional regulator n=1 Tax=Streptomyces bobili TaxID=67280 RepID=UPI00341D39D1
MTQEAHLTEVEIVADDSPRNRSGLAPMLAHIEAELDALPQALARVASEVLRNPRDAATLTLVELAERARTAPASATRFCRWLGYDNYRMFRAALATEIARAEQAKWESDLGQEILPDDPPDRVLEVVAGADALAIQGTAAQIDQRTAVRVAQLISRARRVDLFGVGGSWLSALEMQYRLERIGIAAWSRNDVHSALTSAVLLGAGDIAFGISHSGRTKQTLDVMARARASGATTVALTSFASSPLAHSADLVLTSSVRETTFRPEALAARHSQLLVLDFIYVLIAQLTYERTTYALDATVKAVEGQKA